MPSPVSQTLAATPLMHRRAMQSLVMLSAIIMLWTGFRPAFEPANREVPSVSPLPAEEWKTRRYAIASGDSLSRIFSSQGFSQKQMQQIMAADQSLLALDILRPGHILTFELDDNQQLLAMELHIHAGNRILYQRDDNGEFSYQELLNPGEWHSSTLVGTISGSFYQSAKSAGLNDTEIATVQQLFGDRLDFSRDVQAGAHFQVVRSDNYVVTGTSKEATGLSRIEGVRFFNRRQQFTAFLHDNGQYYAANGDSLERAFMRVPLAHRFRISDDFNPRRLHPVTGMVRPHNGTDFAVPTGSAVLAAAEGRVIRVEQHPFAGRYVEIQHHGQYKTRYLHLSKALVHPGQQVTRGQRIALSGATGRVTGAHLHYELHINNRPVDPMRASIPLATAVPADSRDAFIQRITIISKQMEQQALLARQQSDKAEALVN
ncbi:MAG: peptidase M23 [Rheinheimera sp.]|uniref:peptidoglycan DD-metalloendopeptidase family protein n=1 Tax=Arsukibacterium sp. UBA3155 TaxID=1946058 RepID=UPI000C96277D|nr:peptidoglycan DD-metalloendopeptidase family protein [Arsukibacterium sp. UBA3155]MAD75546.1 peptidase M23 [Rheinheimera sp.]|tara:strand:+ start:39420 stop:40712 length:1293 start_codon:yes stop_codon:yes gene_type:complete